MFRCTRPTYSEETLKYWAERDRKDKEFAERHSHESEKVYKVNGLYIVCIKREYDKCMNKENQYGIQIWENAERKNPEDCIYNKWFNNKAEANGNFKTVVAMAQ